MRWVRWKVVGLRLCEGVVHGGWLTIKANLNMVNFA